MALEDGTNENGEASGTGNDARVAMLNRINDANDEMRADEFESINDDGTTEKFVVRAAAGDDEALTDDIVADPEADAEIARLAAETGAPEEQPQMITRKVNGRDITLSLDDWLARASKVEAADQYLREASSLRNEQLQKAKAPAQADPEPEPTVDDDLAIARAIQMGTEEEAVAALRTLRQPRPSLTKDDVARTIDERLTFNGAIQRYREEFADVVGDPVLNQMALDADKRLLAAGDTRPYMERYTEIGTSIRDWSNKLVASRAPKPTTTAAPTKLERKAAATPAPKAASQKTVSSVEEEADESTASVIANIAKSRGGPQWMNGPMTRQ
jgi:hypothetical protein